MNTILGKLISKSIRTNASNTLVRVADGINAIIFKLRELEDSVPTIGKSTKQ